MTLGLLQGCEDALHDCFCWGLRWIGVLIDSTPGNSAEKDSPVNNPSLQGFKVIDRAKARVGSCLQRRGLVCRCSCVLLRGIASPMTGGIPNAVPSGRRDGRGFDCIQKPSRVAGPKLQPEPAHTALLTRRFLKRKWSHSPRNLGSGSQFGAIPRNAANAAVPTGNNDSSFVVQMDPSRSPYTLDTSYYYNIAANRALFVSDQALMADSATANQVMRNAFDNDAWRSDFSQAMLKLGQLMCSRGPKARLGLNCRLLTSCWSVK
ncbi:hypothetical protein HPP92_022256 [Vanilla planifolia]|uniref:Plant heme peroxidase family profile domain-containing protein n=1 Tax=Vanilla planifolia TaxID=51239 RepID=A0A835PPB7_VANPL|nr:hypothetical protein HPP92_022256 [Vanilla planifolia]